MCTFNDAVQPSRQCETETREVKRLPLLGHCVCDLLPVQQLNVLSISLVSLFQPSASVNLFARVLTVYIHRSLTRVTLLLSGIHRHHYCLSVAKKIVVTKKKKKEENIDYQPLQETNKRAKKTVDILCGKKRLKWLFVSFDLFASLSSQWIFIKPKVHQPLRASDRSVLPLKL